VSCFQEAIDELSERTAAITAAAETNGVVEVVGNPDRMIRSMLSGYVPVDETDEIMGFLQGASQAIQGLVMVADSPRAAEAGVMFTVAQMLVVGTAVERQGTGRLRLLERAARRYFNEFDHLIGKVDYVERQELRRALAAVKR
jgi:hypothetical protein